MLTLQVTAREDMGKDSSATLRSKGMTPAVFYGKKEAAQAITVDARKLESVWKEAGETTLVMLEGLGAPKETLIHDVQIHPVTGVVTHADFYVLEKGKKIEVAVPLHFVGESQAEKAGFIIVKAMHEVEIEVSAAQLPHHLEVDISSLVNLGDHLTVADIKLPSSAELKTNPEETVASVTSYEEVKEEEQLPTKESLAEPVAETPEAAAE
jgi:large subunit ribosomal protein L25